MCLAPYNLTEAAISARELASLAMGVLFDKKEEMHKQDKEDEPQKKRGLFGRFRK